MSEEKLTEVINFRLSKETLDLLDKKAKTEDRTRSKYLQIIVREAVGEA